MWRIASFFLLHRLKGKMLGDARDFNNIEKLAVIKHSFPAKQGAEEKSPLSGRNISGTCAIVCHRQKLSVPS